MFIKSDSTWPPMVVHLTAVSLQCSYNVSSLVVCIPSPEFSIVSFNLTLGCLRKPLSEIYGVSRAFVVCIPTLGFNMASFNSMLGCLRKSLSEIYGVSRAFDDLSFKAVASQSKIALGQPIAYAASNAVDRDIATCTRADEIGMNALDKTTWWKVDLNGTFNIFSINILFKNYENYDNRQRGRLAGFSLFVSNTGAIQGSTLCYKDGPQLPPLNFTTECITSGRYVLFYNERFDGVSYPTGYELTNLFTELCEVIVKGCKQLGVYGSKCDIPCPVKCKGSTCHILRGTCFDCENGVYGGYCNLSCPNSCKDNICNMQSGACLECEHGNAEKDGTGTVVDVSVQDIVETV
eukprot:XP_019920234.1 PREDICTED: uncharacterized protein LOC109617834 [Crassostrea gigas]